MNQKKKQQLLCGFLLPMLIALTLLSASFSEEEGQLRVLYYMIGSNLESKKEAASADLLEILRSCPGENTEIHVLAGGAERWKLNPDMDRRVTLLRPEHGEFLSAPFPPELSMGSGETLRIFLEQCAPAEGSWHLIFWGHGGDRPAGIGWDENHEDAWLSVRVISEVLSAMKNPPTVVGMDACGMCTPEVLQELSDCCCYFVSDTAEETTEGWPHHVYLAELTGSPRHDAEKIRDAANIGQKRAGKPETTLAVRMKGYQGNK